MRRRFRWLRPVPTASPNSRRRRLSMSGRVLATRVDYILDGGACSVGIESTVLSLTGGVPVLLRPGGVSRPQIEADDRTCCADRRRPRARHIPRRACIRDTTARRQSCCWCATAKFRSRDWSLSATSPSAGKGGARACAHALRGRRICGAALSRTARCSIREAMTGLRWTLRPTLRSGRQCAIGCSEQRRLAARD